MPWTSILDSRKITDGRRKLGVGRMAAAGDRWLLRDPRNVYCYRPSENRVLWQIADSSGGAPNLNELVATPNVAVTAFRFGREDKRVWVVGVDPADGSVLWQRRTHWRRGIMSMGGLWLHGDHAVLSEQQGEGHRLVWLSLADGREVDSCASVDESSTISIAGDRLYVHEGSRLLSRPAEPGPGELEEVLNVVRISSLTFTGEEIYGRYRVAEGDRRFNVIGWWDARTFSRKARIDSPTGDDYIRSRVLPADPGNPNRILLHARENLHLIDLETGEEIWHLRHERRIGSPAWTPEGIFFSSRQAHRIDEASGEVHDSPFAGARRIHRMEDFVVADRLLSMQVYAREPGALPEPSRDAWPVHASAELIVETGVEADPREELGRVMRNASVAEESLDPVLRQLQQVFSLEKISDDVQEFLDQLRNGKLDRGPLNFTPWDRLALHCKKYRHLFGFDAGERFFPALLIASESGGVEFWLMLETGTVIDLHHDASFLEEASDVWDSCEPDLAEFERKFPLRGNQLTIRQLTKLQQRFSEVRDLLDLEDLDPEPTFRGIAESFGWELIDLGEWIGDFEYFMALQETHGDVLDRLAVEE